MVFKFSSLANTATQPKASQPARQPESLTLAEWSALLRAGLLVALALASVLALLLSSPWLLLLLAL